MSGAKLLGFFSSPTQARTVVTFQFEFFRANNMQPRVEFKNSRLHRVGHDHDSQHCKELFIHVILTIRIIQVSMC